MKPLSSVGGLVLFITFVLSICNTNDLKKKGNRDSIDPNCSLQDVTLFPDNFPGPGPVKVPGKRETHRDINGIWTINVQSQNGGVVVTVNSVQRNVENNQKCGTRTTDDKSDGDSGGVEKHICR